MFIFYDYAVLKWLKNVMSGTFIFINYNVMLFWNKYLSDEVSTNLKSEKEQQFL